MRRALLLAVLAACNPKPTTSSSVPPPRPVPASQDVVPADTLSCSYGARREGVLGMGGRMAYLMTIDAPVTVRASVEPLPGPDGSPPALTPALSLRGPVAAGAADGPEVARSTRTDEGIVLRAAIPTAGIYALVVTGEAYATAGRYRVLCTLE
jgi:hypothetical protein